MPDFPRKPYKMLVRGLGLSAPPDLLPDGYAPILRNVRPDLFGALTTRQPLKQLIPAVAPGNPVLTLRRLNDPTDGSFARIYTDSGGRLIVNGALKDSGYSGNPTVMVPFRPLQTPRPWMYVSDSARMRKVRSDGLNYLTGIVPPNAPPTITLGAPNYKIVADFRVGGVAPVASWVQGGTAGAPAAANRINTTIAHIVYDSGTTGWATVALTAMGDQVQAGGFLRINAAETVLVHDVSPIATTTTIAAIAYDTGTTGACSIVLAAPAINLKPGSLLELNAEFVIVQSVAVGQDGIPSFRCTTTGTHAAGETVTGFAALRTYTTINHAAAETVTDVELDTSITAGTGTVTFTGAYDLSLANSRPITTADHLHISIKVDDPTLLTQGLIQLDISNGAFNQDYFYYPFTQDQLAVVQGETTDANGNPIPLGQSQWTELQINLAQLIRVGTDKTKTLANVVAIQVSATVTGTMALGVSSWWVGGTYGPDSSDDGTQFLATYRWRASTIGSRSNPAPATRAGVFPNREQLVISGFATSADPQVDTIDVFIFGGHDNNWTLAASIPSTQATATVDLTLAAQQVSERLQFDNFVPFPTTDLPRTGVCNVVGTSVIWVSGDTFNTRWTPGSTIIINGVVYDLYDSPTDTHHLQIVQSASNLTNATFTLPDATLYGTPLPYTCDGGQQNSNVIFATGDPNNPGFLYWGNPNDPDTASDSHNLEVTSPSEPLFMPFVWNGQAYVYSSERLFVISPTQAAGTQRVGFISQEVPGSRGLYAPWFSCVGPIPYFGARDGIYSWGGGEPASITDDSLYPLFPHAGVPGVQTYIYLPVDIASVKDLRLTWCDSALWFSYRDGVGGTPRLMRYDFTHGGGWFEYDLVDTSPVHIVYGEEGGEIETVIAGGDDGAIYVFDAAGTEITGSRVRTAALDMGDSRSQKLYTDAMVDFSIPSTGGALAQVFYDNFESTAPAVTIANAQRGQTQIPIAGVSLDLHRNIALDVQWRGPGSLYEFQPAAEMQPYLSTSFINQAKDLGFTTYGYLREGRIGLISASAVVFTAVIDGVSRVLFIAPSTGGLYRKLYFPSPPVKGKLMLFKAESTTAFSLYPEETEVSAREWGSDGPFTQYKPFAGMMAG